ncbi:MAG TPA: Crp/Fnr family transcriptional regulator [Caulobacteraceae bacterium]|jgi:CRP-like cAMP-binding protein|nr:Crp/Fnr family transcriptional regulator [Caulobacteraceae bacterium]
MEARHTQDDWATLLELAPSSMRRQIEQKARVVRAAKGRTLYGVSARAHDVFFVTEGEVQIVLFSSAGRQVSVNQLNAGASFGQIAALDGLPRSASVVAVTDVRLRAIGREDFLAILHSAPEAAIWVARGLCGDVRRLTERVFELSALNVQSRLHCELLRLARGAQASPFRVTPAPTHAELANRIGSNREAVTREMRVLAELNIIRNQRRSLEFIDLQALERVVRRAVGDVAEPVAAL